MKQVVSAPQHRSVYLRRETAFTSLPRIASYSASVS